jgi:cation diffusion facilitator CzcD-associated flavoprotein CzcO
VDQSLPWHCLRHVSIDELLPTAKTHGVKRPAIFYSFSFSRNPRWSKLHPSGPEIVEYLQGVCENYEIVDKIQLNTDVTEVRWLEAEKEWEITCLHLAPGVGDLSARDRQQKIAAEGEKSVILGKEIVRAKIVASAVGGLVEPNPWPDDIPGKDSFEGEIIHTARWNPNVKLEGKDVVVIGTGCSAAQVIPKLTEAPHNVKSVTQLMRSPPWVVPSIMSPSAEEKWERWTPTLMSNVPGLNYFTRFLFFSLGEMDFFKVFPTSESTTKSREELEKKLMKYMKKVVPEEYHEILTPDYSLGCKRRIIDSNVSDSLEVTHSWELFRSPSLRPQIRNADSEFFQWYASFQKSNVSVTTLPLTAVEPHGVHLGPGRTYPDPSKTDSKAPTDEKSIPANVIILANGFETNNYLTPITVKGKGGKKLHDLWEERGGAQGYLGIAMDSFPNFFMIFG